MANSDDEVLEELRRLRRDHGLTIHADVEEVAAVMDNAVGLLYPPDGDNAPVLLMGPGLDNRKKLHVIRRSDDLLGRFAAGDSSAFTWIDSSIDRQSCILLWRD